MRSRGVLYSLGGTARKSLALLWAAVLLCSLLFQYASLAAPNVALAANDSGNQRMGGFEVDGDFPAGSMTPAGDDWANSANNGAGLVNGPTKIDPISADPTVLSNGVSDGDSVADWQMNGSAQAPQKADVGNVYAVNRVSGGDQWAYIGIERESGQGTVQYDLEFNRLGNRTNDHGVSVPNRSAGDQLFTATQTGGSGWTINATVQHWNGAWNTGSWSAPQTISSSLFFGLANQYDAQHPNSWPDAVGNPVPENQFAEMAMNVSEIASGFIGCPGYGTLNIRSISSQGNTPELKDVIAPIPLDLSTCGQLSWQKQDDSGNPLGGATFTVTPNPATGTGSVDVTDNQAPDTNNAAGFFKLVDVIPGDYTVVEKSAPSGYILDTTSRTVTVNEYQHKSISYVWENTEIRPPKITTTSSTTTADFGQVVHDDATLTGDQGAVTGTVQFFICGPDASAPDCSTGGDKVGSPVTVISGEATSPNYTVGLTADASGYYCWRAEYTPDSSALYLAGKHTNQTTECFYVAPATISITKTANPTGPVNAGDEIGFDITVTNDGTQTTLGVSMTDTLPAGISWTADAPTGATANCSIASGVLTCTASSLAAKASFTVHVHGMSSPAVCGTVSNTADVITSNDGSDSDDASVVVNCPALKVTKTADAASVNAGDDIGFTVQVENTGAGTAYGATLSDPLPAGVTWTVDPAYADQGSCSISSGTLSCDFGDLASGASVSVHVTATTSYAACSTYDNTATASATNAPDASDNASIDCNKPNLVVTKTADNSPISAGDTASFTIVVQNTGPGTAHGVTLDDPLPAGISWVADNQACSISSGTLSCDFGDLASGASATVKVSGETTADSCGQLPNTATASATNAPDASDSATIQVDCPEIVITKTPVDPKVNATDQIAFDIVVRNNGDGNAYNVTVSDTLPTDAGLSWSIDGANSDAGWSIAGGTLSFGPATLGSGESVRVRIVSPTTPATCGTVLNTASLSYDGGSDSDNGQITVDCPDLSLTKTADNSPIVAGQDASFTIQVTNHGDGTAYDVVISDALPAGIDWTENSSSCSITGGVLTCDLGDLAAGDSFSVTVSGPTTAENCGTIPNSASVEASNEAASATEDNSDSAQIDVLCASIQLVKTAGTAPDGEPLQLGNPGSVLFTYVVSNTGTADLENVVLVDDNGTPGDTSDDVTVTCPSTTLAAGDSMTCTAMLPVGYGTRTNVATVTADPVVNPEAQVKGEDDATVVVPEPTPTPSGSVEALTPPPTSTIDHPDSSNQAGFGLLLLLVGLAGLVVTVGGLTPATARARRRSRRH